MFPMLEMALHFSHYNHVEIMTVFVFAALSTGRLY